MKDDQSKNVLLNDCLADIATPSFRDGLLDQMLQHVRARQGRRQRNRVLLAAACVIAALGAIGSFPWKPESQPWAKTNPLEVHSGPLDAAMIVTTRAGGFGLVETSSSGLEVIRGLAAKKSVEPINDSELFALLDGRPAILILHRDLDAELVLVNPDDRDGFVVR